MRANPILPAGTSPLAKKIAAMLKAARKKTGLSKRAFAERAAIPLAVLQNVEDARFVPAPWVLARIDATIGGETFARQSPVRPKPRVSGAVGWQAYRVRLDPALTDRVRRVSSALGITVEATFVLALEHYLDSPGLLATFEEVSRRINRARLIDALGDNPVYRQFLARDLDLCKELGAEVGHADDPVRPDTGAGGARVCAKAEGNFESIGGQYDIEEV